MVHQDVQILRSLPTIREQCRKIYDYVLSGASENFSINEEKINEVVLYVQRLINEGYSEPSSIPFHSRLRHFEVGSINRVDQLLNEWQSTCDQREITRRLLDLVVVSVLLDAGAGNQWKYFEESTGQIFSRSEGLAVASFHMFKQGLFSSNPSNPYQVDSVGLKSLLDTVMLQGFQVSAENPLVGVDGRVSLLNRLGDAIEVNGQYFGPTSSSNTYFRPGNIVDYLFLKTNPLNQISIHELWEAVIYGFELVWPAGRIQIDGHNMGDVWVHSCLSSNKENWQRFVPFHKLSQWLTYSLLEPLAMGGILVPDLSPMTGLPEYRNGGLFIDLEVIVPKKQEILTLPQTPDSEVIVEWRALTVILLDRVHQILCGSISLTPEQFPLVKMLEGGTWKAGRRIASQLRPESGCPPIQILSDGTVF